MNAEVNAGAAFAGEAREVLTQRRQDAEAQGFRLACPLRNFFYGPLIDPWYERGHFPCGWTGEEFPNGWDGSIPKGEVIVF